MKLNENTKVTITIEQLKKLVNESSDFEERARQYRESEKKRDEEIDAFIETLGKMAEYARTVGMTHGTGASERRYVERMEKIYAAVKDAEAKIKEGVEQFNKFARWNAGIDDSPSDDVEVDDNEDDEDDESYLRQREAWAASQHVGASEEDAYSDLDDVRNGY